MDLQLTLLTKGELALQFWSWTQHFSSEAKRQLIHLWQGCLVLLCKEVGCCSSYRFGSSPSLWADCTLYVKARGDSSCSKAYSQRVRGSRERRKALSHLDPEFLQTMENFAARGNEKQGWNNSGDIPAVLTLRKKLCMGWWQFRKKRFSWTRSLREQGCVLCIIQTLLTKVLPAEVFQLPTKIRWWSCRFCDTTTHAGFCTWLQCPAEAEDHLSVPLPSLLPLHCLEDDHYSCKSPL